MKFGCTKVQKPKAKTYPMLGIPIPVAEELDLIKGEHIGWLGLPIGTEEDNEKIMIGFKLNPTKDTEAQFRRILRLLE